jgi:BA14K-like protein
MMEPRSAIPADIASAGKDLQMSKSIRNLVGFAMTLAVAAPVAFSTAPANAGGGHHYYHGGGGNYHGGYNGGDLFAAGVVGAVIGAAVARPYNYGPPAVYVAPQPTYVYQNPPYAYTAPRTYYGPPAYWRRPLSEFYGTPPTGYPPAYPEGQSYGNSLTAEAWTPGWLDYCRNKFRSFDERSGTYLGFDGQRHFCVIR